LGRKFDNLTKPVRIKDMGNSKTVNKDRLSKLVDFLKRSKKYSQADINLCAIPLAMQHFGKVSFKKTSGLGLSQLYHWFSNYYGVSVGFCDNLYTLKSETEALKKLEKLLK
jgi:hypothetical protein